MNKGHLLTNIIPTTFHLHTHSRISNYPSPDPYRIDSPCFPSTEFLLSLMQSPTPVLSYHYTTPTPPTPFLSLSMLHIHGQIQHLKPHLPLLTQNLWYLLITMKDHTLTLEVLPTYLQYPGRITLWPNPSVILPK